MLKGVGVAAQPFNTHVSDNDHQSTSGNPCMLTCGENVQPSVALSSLIVRSFSCVRTDRILLSRAMKGTRTCGDRSIPTWGVLFAYGKLVGNI